MPEVTSVLTVEITFVTKNIVVDGVGLSPDDKKKIETLIKQNLNADHAQVIKCQTFCNDGTGKPEGIILE